MAFIFQAEKKGFISPSKHENPGPGQYESQSDFRLEKGFAPFLSTVERGIDKKIKDTKPGPGSYGSLLTFGTALKPNKTFHATLSPDRTQIEAANLSTAFKSKTKRFEYKIDTDQPGPGTYYRDSGFGKPLSAVALTLKACTSADRVKALPDDRTVIPSIPSYSHHYGYTESDGNKLVLNKNPLIEIQQFVGPGYYDIKDMVQVNPNKGTVWHKSSTKRFESQGSKQQTKSVVGPGTYEVSKLDGAMPKYKSKASSGFASTTNRPFIGKGNPKDSSKVHSKTVDRFAVEFDAEQLTSVIVERKDEDDRFDDGAVPGPGRYHSETWSSSMKTSYKPANFQFFGTTSERFKGDGVGTQGLGPGEYNATGENLKKIINPLSPIDGNKIPKEKPGFRSTDLRFKDVKNPTLGPGVYEPKTTIVDKVADMAKKGYLGSFGSTEIRFKPLMKEGPDILEDAEPVVENAPKQAAHYFRSSTDKLTTYAKPQKDIPPPGTYDPDYYDIAKRIKDSDNYFSTAKKVPFCSSETRFKGFTASNTKKSPTNQMGDESMNLRANKDATFLKRQVPSSVFNSKSERAASCLPRNGMPGPGTYYNTQAGWLKKSYNVKFIEDY